MDNERAKGLYNLGLHEQQMVSETCTVMRVIGGWIYKHYTHEGYKSYQVITTTFVPYANEIDNEKA